MAIFNEILEHCKLNQEAQLLPEAHQTTQGIPDAQFSH